jgi:hypothetical protein
MLDKLVRLREAVRGARAAATEPRLVAYLAKVAALFQKALRGPSEWDVFERELMASYVSSLNQCVF